MYVGDRWCGPGSTQQGGDSPKGCLACIRRQQTYGSICKQRINNISFLGFRPSLAFDEIVCFSLKSANSVRSLSDLCLELFSLVFHAGIELILTVRILLILLHLAAVVVPSERST